MLAGSLGPWAFIFWDAQVVRWVVWVGLVVLTLALLLLIRTRWGQSQPLGKCVVLSLLAHLLLGIYTTTVNIVTSTVGSPDGKGIQVALVDNTGADNSSEGTGETAPWDAVTGESGPIAGNHLAHIAEMKTAAPLETPTASEPQRKVPAEATKTLTSVRAPEVAAPTVEPPPVTAVHERIAARSAALKQVEPLEAPAPPDNDVPPPDAQPPSNNDATSKSDKGAGTEQSTAPTDGAAKPSADNANGAKGGSVLAGPAMESGAPKELPKPFEWRVGNHTQVAKGRGATQESEAAVKAALRWLAVNQGAAGRWEARRLGGGAGRAGDGQDRQGAGSQADVGITALSLLAFLASGNTHVQGSHQTTVRRGLEYLLSVQDASGNLGSSSNRYERMYCHAMATCALSEAYAMSGDERLHAAVRRAIDFTVAAQDPASGGWRYQPHDSGDTSQLGWQVMALKSAELGGIPIPQPTRNGIERFLKSVTMGRDGGLACYQPSRQVVSRSMTAEALACREFLNLRETPAARDEASRALMQELPGAGSTNFYYWYYATLSLYQLQGESWERWNAALQRSLMASQRHDGDWAGSWDPDPVWGGCGGRAYSTALGALCLEVYYRFLPLYVEAAGRETRAK